MLKYFAIMLCLFFYSVATELNLYEAFKETAKRSLTNFSGHPTFTTPPRNVTVVEGQEVTMSCSVSALHEYKLAWVHEDTQSIISIGRQLYTHSKRLSLAADHRTAAITISPVLALDRGWYMCQINTDPMTSSHSYLEVLVPPTLKEWSGPEIEAREGSSVKMVCQARAYPPAQVTWRRTDAKPIFKFTNGTMVRVVVGTELFFAVVSRDHSSTYTCHIDNKETPSLSKDTQLIVTYPPMIWLQDELVGVRQNYDVTLSCTTDANPPPRHFWFKNGTEVMPDQKHRLFEKPNITMWNIMLTIRNAQPKDFVRYSCVASNPIGRAEGTILLYEIKDQVLIPQPPPKVTELDFQYNEITADKENMATPSPENNGNFNEFFHSKINDVSKAKHNFNNKSNNYIIEVTLLEEISPNITGKLIFDVKNVLTILLTVFILTFTK